MKKFTRFFLFFLLTFCAGLTLAQDVSLDAPRETEKDDGHPLYPFWEDVAADAELKIDSPEDVTTDDLEGLRSRIVVFRAEFSGARHANADRIATLQAQIVALGPKPENGAEAASITAERVALNAQLETLRAPVRRAEVSFSRAEGLIGEIDNIIRDRKARRLLKLGPSPLDPRNWPTAIAGATRILSDLGSEVSNLSDQHLLRELQDQLPLVVLLLVFALTLIVRGRHWAGKAIEYMRSVGGRGTGVWSFLLSLPRIILPLIGVFVLAYALRMTGLLGDKTERLLSLLPEWGGLLFGFRWLAERLFARDDDEALILMSKDKRRAARYYMLVLSLLFVSRDIIGVLFDLENAVSETVAVLAFPIVVLIGSALFLLGMLLRTFGAVDDGGDGGSDEESDDEKAKNVGMSRVVRVFGNAMVAVSIVAPTMAAVGYSEAGNALLYPTVFSLVVLGFVYVLQRFAADVYGLLTGQGAEARDGLAAIIMGFVLVLVSLPLLALTWGARVADLTELWTQFLLGFDVGGTRISPSTFLTFVIIFVIGYTITRLLQSTLRQSVLPKTRIDIGGQNALVSGIGYVGIFFAALIAVTVAGLDLSAFAIVAGALSVGIGFGLQTIVSNFVSGIILLVERPISEGDWIEVGGQMGYVKHISVRSTRIETFDRTDVIVPNSDLISGTVTNYTRGNTIGRLIVPVGVAYGTDTKRVDAILREIGEAQPMVLRNPPLDIIFMGFGADSLDFEIRAILRDVNWMLRVKNDINHEIAARFLKEGIEIPFAQRDIWLRNPEALRPGPDQEPATRPEHAVESNPKA